MVNGSIQAEDRRSANARLAFMGTPEFAVPILEALAAEYPLVGVVTQPDRPAGRGRRLEPTPVKQAAVRLRLPVIQPAKLREPDAMAQLRAWAPDLIVVAAFGQILRPEVLELPRSGCLNVHASLLPRWRGATPIPAAILAGDRQTGVSIMQIERGLDTGPVIAKRAIEIAPDDTSGSLSERLSRLGAELLLVVLPDYLAGRLAAAPQDGAQTTYAGQLKKDAGRLDLRHPAEELARQVRAFNPWPAASVDWQGQPLKILRAHAAAGAADIGHVAEAGRTPAVGTGSGLLVLDEVQPAGKKPMSGQAFAQGARQFVGSNLL